MLTRQAALRYSSRRMNMPALPIEIIRLILAHLSLSPPASPLLAALPYSHAIRSERPTPGVSGLLACCLVNKAFLAEAQPLLLHSVYILSEADAKSWLKSAASHGNLASHIRRLCLSCAEAEDAIGHILRTSTKLRCLTLDAKGAESRDCLAECINVALQKCERLECISLTALTSIKTLSMVYNLPYRLRCLEIHGLYKYKGALWDNSQDWIDADSVIFDGVKMVDKWDMHFLFQLFEVSSTKPPRILTFRRCQVSFVLLPEATYASVGKIILEEAPKLLELDHLDRFARLGTLAIGAKHDFIKLGCCLTAVERLHLTSCNAPTFKMVIQWISKGYYPNLAIISMEKAHLQACADGSSWMETLNSVCPGISIQLTSSV